MSKLTKEQNALLKELSSFGGRMTVSDTYAPAKRLVALGYATMEQMRFGGTLFTITPAGRAALEQSDEA